MKPKLTFVSISAIKLAPGDILVVQADKLTEQQRQELDHEIQKQLWGKPNKYIILHGDITIASAKPASQTTQG